MAREIPPPPTNTWKPNLYVKHASFVPAMARDLVEWLAPKAGERVLDLGCGDGVLTMDLVRAGAHVVGVDLSPAMAQAAQVKGLDVRVGTAETLQFENEFDAVFSNAMLHWTRDVDAVLAGVHRALRPGGRFIGEFGGAGNTAKFLAATAAVLTRRGFPFRQPWYYPTPEAFGTALTHAGFSVDRTRLFDRPTPLAGGIVEWLDTFGEPLLDGMPVSDRPTITQEIEDAAKDALCLADGTWVMDYVRLRFAAHRPLLEPGRRVVG